MDNQLPLSGVLKHSDVEPNHFLAKGNGTESQEFF